MPDTNVVTLPVVQHTYDLVEINGQQRVARYNGEYWEVDRTSGILNRMLEDGQITPELAKKWLNQNKK